MQNIADTIEHLKNQLHKLEAAGRQCFNSSHPCTVLVSMLPHIEAFAQLEQQLNFTNTNHGSLPTAGTFVYFTKLLIEIRMMIWDLLLPDRILEVYLREKADTFAEYHRTLQKRTVSDDLPASIFLRDKTPSSITRAICKESRARYLARNETVIGGFEGNVDPRCLGRMNIESDIIYLSHQASPYPKDIMSLLSNRPASRWSPTALASIQSLAIDYSLWYRFQKRSLALAPFAALRRLIIVAHESEVANTPTRKRACCRFSEMYRSKDGREKATQQLRY